MRNSSKSGVCVIIPACNEAAVLPSCLTRLLNQQDAPPMHVIVSANGCTDETADVARGQELAFSAKGHHLTVIELKQGSKPGALNAADAVAEELAPKVRVYLDADVVLSRNAISEVHRVLTSGRGIHLVVPRLRVAPARSRLTRWYGQTWAELPYIRNDVIGCGFYAVSEEGRSRWTTFPTIISDDKFVRLHFERHERAVAHEAYFQIQLPEGLRELVKVRGRWCRGNHELSRTFPALAKTDRGRYRQLLPFFASRPTTWPRLPVFLGVYALAEVAAFWKRRVGLREWERAERARDVMEATPTHRAATSPSDGIRRGIPAAGR